MAEKTVSKNTSIVNENSPIHVEFIAENTPAVLSTEVALRFQKKHQHILRDIDQIHSQVPKIFFETNFGLNERKVAGGFGVRKERSYLLSRDAFSLLVMGFTGSAAIRWKLAYIEAFNTLEAAVLENQAELAREAGYQQGLDVARALPAAEAERKAAYLDGMTEGKRLAEQRDSLRLVLRAKGYLEKGLGKMDTARLCGLTCQSLNRLLQRVRKAGV